MKKYAGRMYIYLVVKTNDFCSDQLLFLTFLMFWEFSLLQDKLIKVFEYAVMKKFTLSFNYLKSNFEVDEKGMQGKCRYI